MGNRKQRDVPQRIHSVTIKKFRDEEKTQTYYHKRWIKDIYHFIQIDEMEQINETEYLLHFCGGTEVMNENDDVYYIKKKRETK